jgi:hypothetical protein
MLRLTTIPYQSPETLLFIAGIAVVCVALLFAERHALRRLMRGATHAPWPQRLASMLRGLGMWWLIVGASGLLIPLFFTVVLGYSSGNANGDLSILMTHILYVAGVLALVTICVTLVLLLIGIGAVFYLKFR